MPRRLRILAGLADQRAQLLDVGVRVLGHPGAERVVVGDQPVAPLLGQVQASVSVAEPLCCSSSAWRAASTSFGVELAHELADELHLAALAFEVGDAFGLGHRVHQLVGQAQRFGQVGAQVQQLFAQVLQFVAFALEIGAAGIGRAFEFALELQVQFAAFGNELASDEVAFFGFA